MQQQFSVCDYAVWEHKRQTINETFKKSILFSALLKHLVKLCFILKTIFNGKIPGICKRKYWHSKSLFLKGIGNRACML